MSAHRLAHVLSSEMLASTAGLWQHLCSRPPASGVEQKGASRDGEMQAWARASVVRREGG